MPEHIITSDPNATVITLDLTAVLPTENNQQTAIIEARCDLCNDSDKGSKDELEFYGWYVGFRSAFCPSCNTPE